MAGYDAHSAEVSGREEREGIGQTALLTIDVALESAHPAAQDQASHHTGKMRPPGNGGFGTSEDRVVLLLRIGDGTSTSPACLPYLI
jgi:hypothetical protein